MGYVALRLLDFVDLKNHRATSFDVWSIAMFFALSRGYKVREVLPANRYSRRAASVRC